jgi:protein translocase SecG subunit
VTLFFTILHVFLCLILVLIVLLQHGKGADVGVVLGGGASQTVFGSRGAGNFLTKMTTEPVPVLLRNAAERHRADPERGACGAAGEPPGTDPPTRPG